MDTWTTEQGRALGARIASRDAVVGIVGLGYVGLPAVKAFHDGGYRVVGYDIDHKKVEHLQSATPYLKHLGADLFDELARSDRFTPTSDERDLAGCDVVILCVPTPLGAHREPDLGFVESSAESVGRVMRPGTLVVLESTTYPGTTRSLLAQTLERAARERGEAMTSGTDFFVAYSPEREDPGRAGTTTAQIPKLVGGVDADGSALAHALYASVIERVVLVESAEIAEAAKLLENVYRAVNIALVNELKVVLDRLGIDIWRVIEAASTKPFGFQAFYPGPGLGGHCIPIDPFYLTWSAKEAGVETKFIELAGEINQAMPGYVVSRVAGALNDEAKAVRGSSVLVLGVAYKPDVDDIREAPAAEIITRLLAQGARVSYHDPHIASFPSMRRYDIDLDSVELTPAALKAADCVLVVTDHSAIDWELVGAHARLVVDTRNAMGRVGSVAARVVKS